MNWHVDNTLLHRVLKWWSALVRKPVSPGRFEGRQNYTAQLNGWHAHVASVGKVLPSALAQRCSGRSWCDEATTARGRVVVGVEMPSDHQLPELHCCMNESLAELMNWACSGHFPGDAKADLTMRLGAA